MSNDAVVIDEVIKWILDQADRYQSSVCCNDPVIIEHVVWLKSAAKAIKVVLKSKNGEPRTLSPIFRKHLAKKRKRPEQMR